MQITSFVKENNEKIDFLQNLDAYNILQNDYLQRAYGFYLPTSLTSWSRYDVQKSKK